MTSPTLSSAERIEEEASVAGLAAAETLRAVEIVGLVLVGLLVCPPLAILAVVVVVPLLVIAVVLAVLGAVLATPYLVVQHFRGHPGGHLSVLTHRLRAAGRALADLAPHRIHAAAREAHSR